jgi:hypothetical protein
MTVPLVAIVVQQRTQASKERDEEERIAIENREKDK